MECITISDETNYEGRAFTYEFSEFIQQLHSFSNNLQKRFSTKSYIPSNAADIIEEKFNKYINELPLFQWMRSFLDNSYY